MEYKLIDKSLMNNSRIKILKYIEKTCLNNRYDEIAKKLNIPIYSAEIKKNNIGLLLCSRDKIVINSGFVMFDSNGNYRGLTANGNDIVNSQLTHELWHAVSRRNEGNSGIDNICWDLNEGITQMLSEEANGFVVSKNTDGYTDFKKFAKILKNCTSIDSVLDTYVNGTNSLEIDTNKVANDSNFYKNLINQINRLRELKKLVKVGTLESKTAKYLYYRKIELIYQYLITYLVVPKYNSITDEIKRNEFLNSILQSVTDDAELYNTFVSYLKYSLNLSVDNYFQEKNSIVQKMTDANDYMKIFDAEKKEKYSFMDNGKIIMTESGREVVNEKLCSLIYFQEYIKNQGKYKFTLSNNSLLFNNSDTIKDKRIKFIAAKQQLNDSGEMVLNQYDEVDNLSQIDLNCISNGFNKSFSLDDLKGCFLKFDLEISHPMPRHFIYTVINKSTGKVVTDDKIESLVRFANLWFSSLCNGHYDEYTIDRVFGDDYLSLYNTFMKVLISNVEFNGNLAVEKIFEVAGKNDDYEMELFLQNMFKMPESYEWIYNYINYNSDSSKLQIRKEKSYFEQLTEKNRPSSNYEEILVDDDIEHIEGMNR